MYIYLQSFNYNSQEADEEAAKTNGHSEETNGVANGDSGKFCHYLCCNRCIN